MILSGAAIMAFGLFIFYAWLPVLYALVGFDIGLLFGAWLTGTAGWIAIVLGIIGAVLLGFASYFLEGYRRILLGVAGGVLVGLSLAALLGLHNTLGGAFGVLLAVVLGAAGGIIVPRIFDTFVIVASAVGGAGLIMNGAHLILPGLGLLDRSSGRFLPSLLTAILAVIGIGWQMSNISKWVNSLGVISDARSNDATRSRQ